MLVTSLRSLSSADSAGCHGAGSAAELVSDLSHLLWLLLKQATCLIDLGLQARLNTRVTTLNLNKTYHSDAKHV